MFEGVNLDSPPAAAPPTAAPAAQTACPYTDIFTTDYPRGQTWSHGDRFQCCSWFSLMNHYNQRLPTSAWQRNTLDRPVVWLATSNHMMAERNLNESTAFPNGWRAWSLEDYDPHLGSRVCAEAYAKSRVPVLTNLFSCCCWKARRPTS